MHALLVFSLLLACLLPQVTAGALAAAESAPLAAAIGPASKLLLAAQPGTSTGGQPFPTQPVVAVVDASGNTVTSGTDSTATVTLSLGGGAPPEAVLTCTGGLSKAAVAGVATFADCAINRGGYDYTLVASATGLTSATSASFFVMVPSPEITVTSLDIDITYGSSTTLQIQFNGPNVANQTFDLDGSRDYVPTVAESHWTTLATLTTDAGGMATFTYRPTTTLWYRANFAGSPYVLAGMSSQPRRITVRQIALLRPTNLGEIKSIRRNHSVTFTTTVRPAGPGLPHARVTFVFYHRVGSVWTLVTKRTVLSNSLGKASARFTFTRTGSWYVRSMANPTQFNANSVWSPPERYTVR